MFIFLYRFHLFVLYLLYINSFVPGLDLLKISIEKAGYTGKIDIGMDVAASGKQCFYATT